MTLSLVHVVTRISAAALLCVGLGGAKHVAVPASTARPGTPRIAEVLDESMRPRRVGDGAPAGVSSLDVRVDGERVGRGLRAVMVLPGQGVRIEATDFSDGAIRYQDGRLTRIAEGSWRWVAPDRPGIYALRLTSGIDAVDLTALVLHPAASVTWGVLNGYRIGAYRQKPLRGDAAYVPPRGFVEVSSVDQDVLVSPRFTLRQFLCKQPGEPRYVALSVPLVDKLEAISDLLDERGYPAGSLHVMSGFRTPAYNAAIGNRTVYSRHLWGDAADVFVDADGNGEMDDLDGDGRSTVADARLLGRWVESLDGAKGWRPGGLGIYRRNAVHGPFVHVDARGTTARW